MKNKSTAILLIILFVLLLIILIVIVSNNRGNTNQLPPSSPTNQPSVPTQTIPIEDSGTFVPGSLDEDFQRIEDKKPLSENDAQARRRFIGVLNGRSGIVNQTVDYKIEYVQGPDLFMIEITSNNTTTAKISAEGWLKNQGLSGTGICNLPVLFYVSPSVREYLKSSGNQFDPIPGGCN